MTQSTGQRIFIRIVSACENTIPEHDVTWLTPRLCDFFSFTSFLPGTIPTPWGLYSDKYSLIEIADELAGVRDAKSHADD